MADEPPQNIKEYDPEWARAFVEGTVAMSCPHEKMLAQVKAPVLLTHHGRAINPATGHLIGALSDEQARKGGEIITAAGQAFVRFAARRRPCDAPERAAAVRRYPRQMG